MIAPMKDIDKLPKLVGRVHNVTPGQLIREELTARGWTQADLADVIGRPLQTVNQIINGRKRITPETAVELAAAFGTSPEVWLNLENAYGLARVRRPQAQIARRAHRLLARTG